MKIWKKARSSVESAGENKVKSSIKVRENRWHEKKSLQSPFIQASDFTLAQRALGTFHPFHISSAFSQRYSAARRPLYWRGSTAWRGVSSIHSFINHLSMRRPWPIGQLRPPDTPGLIKTARDNGITGQINDPLMKSPTKQAKTARPTYVFHHAVALTFPLA